MEASRASQAVSRIEAALARIERAAEQAPASTASDSDLALRHRRLEDTVRKQLGELDTLIARLEQ